MKILITGGAGFIGSHTAVALTEAGYTPVIIDNFSNAERWIIQRMEEIISGRIRVYEGNCNNPQFVNSVFLKERGIGGIIHFAAHKAVGESMQKPLLYYHNNINSLLTILTVMQKHTVPNIVFSSSATVYGEPDANPLTENAPRKKATNPYGNTKSIAEDILHDVVASGADIAAIPLRYFNPIGAHTSHMIGELPNGVPSNLVPYITQTAAGIRDSLTIFGNDYDTPDGTCIRDFIHVMDLADAHVAAITYLNTQKKPFFDIFNVGTGKGTSVMELIVAFEKANNISLNYTIGPRRAGDISACWADTTKINTVIGWHAQRSITQAMKDAWAWQTSLAKK